MRDVGRTRPGKAKERVTEERVNMKGKGGAGSKGRQQVENPVTDEDQGNTGVMKSKGRRGEPQRRCEEVGRDDAEGGSGKGRGGGR